MKKGVYKTCEVCGKETYRFQRDLRKNHKHVFCSSKCMGKNRKGQRVSVATEFKKGLIPWSKGKKIPHNPHSGDFKKGMTPWNKGLIGFQGGEKNNMWKGGITPINQKIRGLLEMRFWREAVFKRDKYRCVWCGDDRGGNLNADHIKAFSVIVFENGIKSVEDARACAELWDVANGRTLCEPCHKTTDTYLSLKVRKVVKGY